MSLGCSKNLVDSEVLLGQLKANDFEISVDKQALGSDAVVINTCGFINDSKEESIDTILQYLRAKEEGKIGKVYVMGCLSERYVGDLKKEIPDVDKYFGVNNLKDIVAELGGNYRNELIGERQLTTPSHYAYLKISEGCDRRCTFCAIPSIRGKHKSKPLEELVVESRRLAAKGIKELMLIAQDLNYYGIDLYRKNRFADLLRTLSDLPAIEWIRLHYMYPAGFPLEILDLIKERENICNYIDMPIQHISSRMLGLMQRGHSQQGTLDLLDKIKTGLPGVSLRTTLIVGFPGEPDADFQMRADFVKE